VESLTSEAAGQRGGGAGLRIDVATYLTIWLVLLYGINARQIVGFVGATGSPALLLALPAAFLWASGWLLPDSGLRRDPHPLRAWLLVFFGFTVFSYALGLTRPLSEAAASSAMRGLITWFALVGVALLVADGIGDPGRLRTLLRRLVWIGGASALLGILQFFTGESLQVSVPGLEWSTEDAPGMRTRAGFDRTRGTAMHSIEYSVVLAALVPLAIHFAIYGRTRLQRQLAALSAAGLLIALPTTLSRSGILSVAGGVAVLALCWSWRRIVNAALTGLVVVPLIWMAIPGLLDALIGLFTNTDESHSIQARAGRVPRVMELVRARPWLGIGAGTYTIEDYFLLDNQLWKTMIETGIIGTALLVLLLLVGMFAAASTARAPWVDEEDRHLGFAVAGCIAALSISIATFDTFFYRILTGTLFLMLGVAGALWRLRRSGPAAVDHRGVHVQQIWAP
jgi:polysaccharide biosynthesis protein PslJ